MFGMGTEGTTNLITRALAAVGKRLDTVPDPTQIHYHLPCSSAHPEVSSPLLASEAAARVAYQTLLDKAKQQRLMFTKSFGGLIDDG